MSSRAASFVEETDAIKRLILEKLIRGNIWGRKHTPLDFVTNGMPEHYHNTHKGMKVIDKVLKELTNDEWIIIVAKRTGKGSDKHLPLNPRKKSNLFG